MKGGGGQNEDENWSLMGGTVVFPSALHLLTLLFSAKHRITLNI